MDVKDVAWEVVVVILWVRKWYCGRCFCSRFRKRRKTYL